MTSVIRAGLATAVDRETQAALDEAGRRTPADFLLVPESSRTSSVAASTSSLAETLPQVGGGGWQAVRPKRAAPCTAPTDPSLLPA